MSWINRLRQAAYTSPGGTRTLLDYEDVSKSVEKRTAAYEFPNVSGTLVKDFGSGGRRVPLRVFFWGEDYDLQVAEFESSILEVGEGVLEHPIYGRLNVVPFGVVSRRDDLKTAANQAIIELTFFETLGAEFTSPQSDPVALIDAISMAPAVDEFTELLSLATAIERVTFQNVFYSTLDETARVFGFDVNSNIIYQSILQSRDLLVTKPAVLAAQLMQLFRAEDAPPQTYSAAAAAVTSTVETPTRDARAKNIFAVKNLFANAVISSQSVNSVSKTYVTRRETIAAAESVLVNLDTATTWASDNFEALDIVDPGEGYANLQQSAALAAGHLIEASFSARVERTLTLDRARTIIDLVAHLYGAIDGQLDFFITSNNLSGDEIIELPAGKNVYYY